MKIAINGASGKTGYRISEEAVKKGYKVRPVSYTHLTLPTTPYV